MGFFSNLFKRNKSKPAAKTPVAAEVTDAPSKEAEATAAAVTKAQAKAAKPAAKPVTKTATKTTKADELQPQCAALTAAGAQCKRSARQGSKYCGSHKGYRPPAAAVANKAKDTKPAVKKAKDTAPSGRRTHFTHNGYKLYQKGNRYYFSKKSQADAKKDGAAPVYALPEGRSVSVTPNGLPVLKKD